MSGRKRDFSEELFGYFDGELAGDNFDIDSEADGFLDGVRKYFPHYGSEIEAEANSIEAHIRTVSEKNRAARKELWRRYGSVRDIEAACAGRTRSVTEALIQYKSIVEMMRDTVRAVKGSTPIDAAALREKLAPTVTALHNKRYALEIRQAEEVKKALEQYVDPITGAYKWEAIAAALQADPKDVSPAEMTALCMAYLSMESPGDINLFLAHGYGIGHYAEVDTHGGLPGWPTEMFQAVAANVELMVAGAVQHDLAQGNDGSAYNGMLVKAQILTYAVNEVPQAYFVLNVRESVVTEVIAVPLYTNLCVQSTEDGGLELLHNDQKVEFDLTQEYIVNQYVPLAEDFVAGRQQDAGDIVAGVLSGALMAYGIGAAVTMVSIGLGAGPKLLEVISKGIDEGFGFIQGGIDKAQYDRDSSEFLNDMYDMEVVQLLGGKTYIVNGPGSKQTLFGTTYRTTKNAVYTYGFVNSDLNTYGVTKEELEGIIASRGNAPNSNLTPEQQAEVIGAYVDEWVVGDDPGDYRDDLNNYLGEHPDLLGTSPDSADKKDIGDCTYEELQKIIAAYNNSLG